MGCLKLTYQNFESPLKVVYKKPSSKENIVQRFLSVDPLAKKNASWTSYVYCGNNPIIHIDPDGRDWIVSTTTNKDGSQTVHLKLIVAVHNASSSTVNMTDFANSLSSQVKNSYGINYTKEGLDAITLESGLDNYPSKTIYTPKDVKVNVVVDVQIRVITSEKELKSNEHLVQIQDASSLPNVYGKANKIGGKKVFINANFVPNILNGNDNNTLVHELGHTFGLRHIDKAYESFWDFFGGNPQYYDAAKQKLNSNNAMFSGSSSYMNDKTSTQINGEQMEIGIDKLNNGKLNQN